jgi:uncharacterized protein (DUF488 family)
MIYTIGYQFISLDGLVSVMDKRHIDLLVDVRSVPYSRVPEKYEFNRNRMEKSLGERYLWLGDECGGKKPLTKKCIDDIVALATAQEEDLLGPRDRNLLLLCMEHDPLQCHRFYDLSKKLLKRGVEAYHIRGSQLITTTDLITEERDVKEK